MMQTILIVEDNPDHMELTAMLLERAGYQVLKATRGEAGVQMARQFRPDLALVDIVLPGMDGMAVMRELKSDERTKTMPIVAITSYSADYPLGRVLEAGGVGLIEKPFHYKEFLKMVEAVLPSATPEL